MRLHHPEGMLVLTVIEPSASAPTHEARQDLATTIKSNAEHTLASALVMMATGMQQTVVRASVTATRMLVGSKNDRLKTFTDLDEALHYLAEAATRAAVKLDTTAALQLVHSLRDKGHV